MIQADYTIKCPTLKRDGHEFEKELDTDIA